MENENKNTVNKLNEKKLADEQIESRAKSAESAMQAEFDNEQDKFLSADNAVQDKNETVEQVGQVGVEQGEIMISNKAKQDSQIATMLSEKSPVEQDKLNILMGMDVYLPDVDGVVNCMHNYCLNLNQTDNITAIAPAHKEQDKVKLPYKLLRCKSIYVPILRDYYGQPNFDKNFKEAVMSQKYDIVHVHSPFKMAKFALSVARRQNIPAVITFHSDIKSIFLRYCKIKWLANFIVKQIGKIYNKYDKVFVVSELVEQQVRECGYTGEVAYLPFGTDLEHLSEQEIQHNREIANQKFNLKEDELVFLYVGRIMPLKRVDFSLEALKILKDKGIKFKFFVVGKGSGLKGLKAYAKELGFTDEEVIFTGFLDRDLLPIINSRADLFLFPSLYDNFGLVKVEAAAYNTPGVFVQGSCAGVDVQDNFNGFLCQDNVQNYANTILRAINDKQNLQMVGKRAGDTLYISWSECVDRLREEYRNIINDYKSKNDIQD